MSFFFATCSTLENSNMSYCLHNTGFDIILPLYDLLSPQCGSIPSDEPAKWWHEIELLCISYHEHPHQSVELRAVSSFIGRVRRPRARGDQGMAPTPKYYGYRTVLITANVGYQLNYIPWEEETSLFPLRDKRDCNGSASKWRASSCC